MGNKTKLRSYGIKYFMVRTFEAMLRYNLKSVRGLWAGLTSMRKNIGRSFLWFLKKKLMKKGGWGELTNVIVVKWSR